MSGDRTDVDAALDGLGPEDPVPDTVLDALAPLLDQPAGDESARLQAVLSRARDARWERLLSDEGWTPSEADLDALERAAHHLPANAERERQVLADAQRSRVMESSVGEAPVIPVPANWGRMVLRVVALAAGLLLTVVVGRNVSMPVGEPTVRGTLDVAPSMDAYVADIETAAARTLEDFGDPGWLDRELVLSVEVTRDGTLVAWRVETGATGTEAAEIADTLLGRVQPTLAPPVDVDGRIEVTLSP
ncbi:MAG: hypothetical protein KDA24_28340 [Deltaproteobacteria bacterium]|nr:hypothetical protein [Deltaproteobacteria bacterium]